MPEHHTDFIFAVVGESWGFVGCALILSLYALIIWRGLRILTMSKNLFGALIAGGIVGMLLFQMFVNVGMTIGIMPITGIPLPLFSYGGSSVLMTFMALGLLQAVHVQGKAVARASARPFWPSAFRSVGSALRRASGWARQGGRDGLPWRSARLAVPEKRNSHPASWDEGRIMPV